MILILHHESMWKRKRVKKKETKDHEYINGKINGLYMFIELTAHVPVHNSLNELVKWQKVRGRDWL
jgi:hypothetical protein